MRWRGGTVPPGGRRSGSGKGDRVRRREGFPAGGPCGRTVGRHTACGPSGPDKDRGDHVPAIGPDGFGVGAGGGATVDQSQCGFCFCEGVGEFDLGPVAGCEPCTVGIPADLEGEQGVSADEVAGRCDDLASERQFAEADGSSACEVTHHLAEEPLMTGVGGEGGAGPAFPAHCFEFEERLDGAEVVGGGPDDPEGHSAGAIGCLATAAERLSTRAGTAGEQPVARDVVEADGGAAPDVVANGCDAGPAGLALEEGDSGESAGWP